MTTTTTLARGAFLSRSEHVNGWMALVDSPTYTAPQRVILADVLLDTQQTVFNLMLPDGCAWLMSASEIVGPVGTVLPDEAELRSWMTTATEEVIAKSGEIEVMVLTTMERGER
jgi:hypothetical protein